MSYVTVPSYEGNSPFIYVYCAEEDTRLALPVLTRLYNEGLRMWSWGGCENPSEVRASQRIASCAALLIFLSENLDRDIQRECFEAMEALRSNKVKYFVRLSDVELPFDWGKSDANVVIDYARSNEAKFWLSIYDSDIIESCRGAWPEKKITAGMSEFDLIDSGELSAEYSDITKIIGTSPALDRSGVPINAEDIALFASAGEKESVVDDSPKPPEISVAELNRESMADLFGMLDEISVSTKQKADELRLAAEKRKADRDKAAMSAASLPFQHDAVPVAHTDEPPVPALSFLPRSMSVEDMAAEMFGLDSVDLEPFETEDIEPETAEKVPVTEEISVETEEVSEAEPVEMPTFEEFIDGLIEDRASEPAAETEITAEPEPVHMATAPITVEIEEEPDLSLLPPAVESLTDFTLPDDKFTEAQFVVNDDEVDPEPTAAERAERAQESRKQFEDALERAAYTVTGRIVARHSKGLHSVGLKVRKPKTVKLAVRTKSESADKEKEPVRVTPVAVEQPAREETAERPENRRERRGHRRRNTNGTAESTDERRVTVTPEPMRGEMPMVSKPLEALQSEIADSPTAETAENGEVPSPRKKRHPHNSSGLLDILRTMRRENTTEQSDEG